VYWRCNFSGSWSGIAPVTKGFTSFEPVVPEVPDMLVEQAVNGNNSSNNPTEENFFIGKFTLETPASAKQAGFMCAF